LERSFNFASLNELVVHDREVYQIVRVRQLISRPVFDDHAGSLRSAAQLVSQVADRIFVSIEAMQEKRWIRSQLRNSQAVDADLYAKALSLS